ncbi:MAG: hypothetical protein Q9165_000673 [Trypethelium subeluteriae]
MTQLPSCDCPGTRLPNIRDKFPEIPFRDLAPKEKVQVSPPKEKIQSSPSKEKTPRKDPKKDPKIEKKFREQEHRKVLGTLMSKLEVALREHGDLVGCQSQTTNNRENSHLEHVKVDILRESGRVNDQYYWIRDHVRGKAGPLVASIAANCQDPKIAAKICQLQEYVDLYEEIFQGLDSQFRCQTGRIKVEDNRAQMRDDSMEDDSVKMGHGFEESEWILAGTPCSDNSFVVVHS